MNAGHSYGFGVTLIDAFRDENADVVSSSHIRALLKEGSVSEVAGMLGYRYTVEAEVIDGEKLGRQLGFPTANMRLPPEVDLAAGIYAVRFRRQDGTLHDAVASYGRRPTVTENGAPLLETLVSVTAKGVVLEERVISTAVPVVVVIAPLVTVIVLVLSVASNPR